MTTDEAARLYGDDSRVFGSGIEHEQLQNITEERMNELIGSIGRVDATHVIIGGMTIGTIAAIWPFTIAYMRGKITYDSFERALVAILGDSGVALASSLAYAALLGPLFAWYLLARGVNILSKGATRTVGSKKVVVKV